MVLWELFTKEEHKKIKRKFCSLKEKDVDKFVKEVCDHSLKISNNGGDDRLRRFWIMAYIADKE